MLGRHWKKAEVERRKGPAPPPPTPDAAWFPGRPLRGKEARRVFRTLSLSQMRAGTGMLLPSELTHAVATWCERVPYKWTDIPVELPAGADGKALPHAFSLGKHTPPPRSGHAMVQFGERIILWGGQKDSTDVAIIECLSDLWEFNLRERCWRELRSSPQSARVAATFGHAMAVTGCHLFLYGGQEGAGPTAHHRAVLDTAYWLDLRTLHAPQGAHWRSTTCNLGYPGKPEVAPGARWGHSLTRWRPRGRAHSSLVMFGGMDSGGTAHNSTWALDPAETAPGGWAAHDAAPQWDGKWRKLETCGDAPVPRRRHTASSYRTRFLIVFAGRDNIGFMNDLHVLDLQGDAEGNRFWTRIETWFSPKNMMSILSDHDEEAAAGRERVRTDARYGKAPHQQQDPQHAADDGPQQPPARTGHIAVCGGGRIYTGTGFELRNTPSGDREYILYSDLWEYNIRQNRWAEVCAQSGTGAEPKDSPAPRSMAAALPIDGSLVLFGGRDEGKAFSTFSAMPLVIDAREPMPPICDVHGRRLQPQW